MILWTDIESTGFDERECHLLEVALVVTDDDLREQAATSVVLLPVGISVDEMVEKMDPYVRAMHTKNGLLDDVRRLGMRRYEGEDALVRFLHATFASVPDVALDKCVSCGKREAEHVAAGPPNEEALKVLWCPGPASGKSWLPKMIPALSQTPFAGSTVSFDRRWLRAHMPTLEALVSYRSIDVSSLTELARRWSPEAYAGRPGAGKAKEDLAHRALADVRESIAYLRYYRERNFVGGAR